MRARPASPPRPPSYVELDCRSAYSLLGGASRPGALVTRAAELGLAGLALTDVDDLGGAVRFQVAAEQAGILAVQGATLTLEGEQRVILLVKDRRGWGNLCRLLSHARIAEPRGSPRTTWARLARRAQGLFALTGGRESPVAGPLSRDDVVSARGALGRLREVFGEDLAVQVWRHGLPAERRLSERLIALAKAETVPWVPTNEVRYARPEDRRAYDVLTCLKHRVTLDEAGTRLLPNDRWCLRGPAELLKVWRGEEAALARTVEIARRCAFDVRTVRPRMPAFSERSPEEEQALLRRLVWEGARARYGEAFDERHRRQLAHELRVIRQLDLAGYFLIVHDVVAFARARGILAQGRGSAANSAVCYCLGITAVDPVGMDLLFERFLSPERTDPPDIDVDIEHMRREDVLQYVYERYGRRHAAMVCETITWRGRSAVRDVARVLGFDVDTGARLSLQVGGVEAGEAAELLEAGGAEAAGLDPGAPRVQMLVDVVRRLDRLPRHRSIHVGGFVLTREPLDTVAPIEAASMEGRTVIQWDKDDLPAMGLVKIDLLGLGILSMLSKALVLIREARGVEVDLARLPMDDPAVYEMVGRADTIGVFQLESRAQMNVLPRLKPQRFYDIVVQVALIRPGPIQGQMVHPYIRRRRGEEPVAYLHPDLEPVLARTLGVPLFQEQGMKVAITMAGFTPGQADRLRKIMGFKRAVDHLQAALKDLWEGMRRKGVSDEVAFRIIGQLEGFANYGFPESHAASFALLAYASAWVRCHYAPEFLAALLNAQPMGFYSPAVLVGDARRHGVEVRPVDLLFSRWECTVEPGEQEPAVRLGLRMVRGLSTAARDTLQAASEAAPLASLEDVVFRSGLDDRAVQALARAGVFRSVWPGRRAALWEVLRRLRERGGALALKRSGRERYRPPSMSFVEEVAADYAAVGASHQAHPMSFHRAHLAASRVLGSRALRGMGHGRRVQVAGLVICRQRPGSAKGVFFMTLEDEDGMVNVAVMPDVFEANRILLATARALVVEGVVEREQDALGVLGRRFWELPPLVRARSRDFR